MGVNLLKCWGDMATGSVILFYMDGASSTLMHKYNFLDRTSDGVEKRGC